MAGENHLSLSHRPESYSKLKLIRTSLMCPLALLKHARSRASVGCGGAVVQSAYKAEQHLLYLGSTVKRLEKLFNDCEAQVL